MTLARHPSEPRLPQAGEAVEFATLDEIRAAALGTLDGHVRDFLEGGAGDEVTLLRNRRAFDRWTLRPRVMSGLGPPTTATTFMGIPLALPVLTAPFGAEGLFHGDGHRAVARANRAAGTMSVVPEAGTFSVEDVAAAAPGSPMIGQFHPMGREATFLAMMRRYERAGYRGLCITCDCPTPGWRERNHRNRFFPPVEVLSGNYPPGSETELEEAFGQLYRHDTEVWGWERLGRLMRATDLPWMAKGIMTADDARSALDAGATAILVSNHGGRQLDGVDASLDALASIADAVGDRADIALDSGVRRGSDIAKALALGADVVVLGRLAVYGLAAAGAAGIARVMELLREELITVLTLLGRGGVADLDRSAVEPAGHLL